MCLVQVINACLQLFSELLLCVKSFFLFFLSLLYLLLLLLLNIEILYVNKHTELQMNINMQYAVMFLLVRLKPWPY